MRGWQAAIANGRYCHDIMYKHLYPSIRVRTAPPVSVRVRTRVSVSFSSRLLFCMCRTLRQRTFAIADLNHVRYKICQICYKNIGDPHYVNFYRVFPVFLFADVVLTLTQVRTFLIDT